MPLFFSQYRRGCAHIASQQLVILILIAQASDVAQFTTPSLEYHCDPHSSLVAVKSIAVFRTPHVFRYTDHLGTSRSKQLSIPRWRHYRRI
ncbi:hypothetical protein L210DRAFT_3586598 [Boletus edulis BED1]|uniref:Uncharacterized protein n=1 Tax=Boletus edulis BED1 TaxID=1328754 RepID=A0AAD4G670_BOLED|nr:hypothetical protein L210DRAFT_3586598 [Boletus edulis BED1]